MDEFMNELKIPKERVAVLIGEKGETKRKIEKKLNVKLKIDSKEGEVEILGDDAFNLLIAEKIVKAIARGFNPKYAMQLTKEDFTLDVVDITKFIGKTDKQLIRVRSRIIGANGKARRTLESLTETKLVIFGKTVSILGDYANVALARKAVVSLLSGSRHASVYNWLERQRKELNQNNS